MVINLQWGDQRKPRENLIKNKKGETFLVVVHVYVLKQQQIVCFLIFPPTHTCTYTYATHTSTTLHWTKSNKTACFCSNTGGVTQIQNWLLIRFVCLAALVHFGYIPRGLHSSRVETPFTRLTRKEMKTKISTI